MSDYTERLIAIIEKLVEENAMLHRELAKNLANRQVVTVPGITYRGDAIPTKTTDPIKPPYTITCNGGES